MKGPFDRKQQSKTIEDTRKCVKPWMREVFTYTDQVRMNNNDYDHIERNASNHIHHYISGGEHWCAWVCATCLLHVLFLLFYTLFLWCSSLRLSVSARLFSFFFFHIFSLNFFSLWNKNVIVGVPSFYWSPDDSAYVPFSTRQPVWENSSNRNSYRKKQQQTQLASYRTDDDM